MKKILIVTILFLTQLNLYGLSVESRLKVPYWKTKKYIDCKLELTRVMSQRFFEEYFEKRWGKNTESNSKFSIARKKYCENEPIPNHIIYELKVIRGKLCINNKIFTSRKCYRAIYFITTQLKIYVYFEDMFEDLILPNDVVKDIISFGEIDVTNGEIWEIKNNFKIKFSDFVQIIDVLHRKKFRFTKTYVKSKVIKLKLDTYCGNIKVRDLNWERGLMKSA